jgi:hypothetical protein
LALLAAPTASHAANVAAQVAATPVSYTACPGYPEAEGCLTADTIYVNSGGRGTLEHERGHMFDRVALTDDDRAWFARLVGMPRQPWISQDPGTESPSERFADAYAACKLHKRARLGRAELTGYGFVIQADGRYKRICLAISVLELVR